MERREKGEGREGVSKPRRDASEEEEEYNKAFPQRTSLMILE